MKNKQIIALLLAACMVLCLCACSAPAKEYKEDVSVSALSAAIDEKLTDTSLTEMQSSYVSGAMKLDVSLFDSYIVKVNAQGVNIDEYGVFKAPNKESVAGVKDAVEGYLKLRRDSWMDEYMPEEKPKLESASVTVVGLYVYYTILEDDARSAIATEIESTLKA